MFVVSCGCLMQQHIDNVLTSPVSVPVVYVLILFKASASNLQFSKIMKQIFLIVVVNQIAFDMEFKICLLTVPH